MSEAESTVVQENTANGDLLFTVLALRDTVVVPHSVVPLFVGRDKSIQTIKHVAETKEPLLLVTQRDPKTEDPEQEDLYSVGTVSSIVQISQLPDGSLKTIVEGKKRVRIVRAGPPGELLQFYGKELLSVIENAKEAEALRRLVVTQLEQYLKLNKKNHAEIMSSIQKIADVEQMADTVVGHLAMGIELKQEILEAPSVDRRLEMILGYLGVEIEVAQVQKRIWGRVKNDLERQQREYVLQMQRKAIENELGDEGGRNELGELEEKISDTPLSAEARTKAMAELKKLRYMNAMSSEATVIRNYLDWLLEIPWNKRSRLCRSLPRAETILNREHYGLERVKEKILEFLAVQARTGKTQGTVLCLVGPPGVGKTSLGKSIARATGREFVRFSLGGIRDEAEIRGHRRTYIGAMPGKIIQKMKEAKTVNPLFLFDEIDKLGSDWRGDPSSALLEVLDPEQNQAFNDNYLEVGYDLSNVMFVCTANTLDILPALRDRMEIVRISGYTEDEKVEIAKRHLTPEYQEKAGLKAAEFHISDEAIRMLIRRYCREAGVRNLSREIASLTRKVIKEIMSQKAMRVRLTKTNLEKYAGIPRYPLGEAELLDAVGVTTALAWTEVGGELLSVEAVILPGKGQIKTTGKLGEVMKESIQAASSFVRSKAVTYGIAPPLFEHRDIHVHVPEGATPKDGPSAGVAMCTSIVSVLTKIPVRGDVAMTGEISLRGRVLPIGGLKEKILAAHRGGIKTVIIPKENMKDLEELPKNVKQELTIVPVMTIDEVLRRALKAMPKPIEWNEDLSFITSSQTISPSPT